MEIDFLVKWTRIVCFHRLVAMTFLGGRNSVALVGFVREN
jgi:hypothetical protein